MKLSPRERDVYDLVASDVARGVYPSMRSVSDRLETRKHGAKRYSYDKVYRLVRSIIKKNYFKRIEPKQEHGKKGPIRLDITDQTPPPS